MATPKTKAAAVRKGPLSEISYGIRQRGTEGALHRALGVPMGKKIPTGTLQSKAARLRKKAAGDKKLSASELRRSRQVQAALRFRGQ